MMGVYPACPGDMDFQLTRPLFEKITIPLDPLFYRGKEFVIVSQKIVLFDNYFVSLDYRFFLLRYRINEDCEIT
jgi:putative alpha-1,2-mannosidase